ncbi:MAG: D-aminoacylase, partial [Sphingomonadaceae bacterium]|nr:D-aminoacylase [Sphingomonadaceae bacterium]
VTLEVIGEESMGPLSPAMRRQVAERQSDLHYPVTWSTLDGYFAAVERHGIGPNLASFVGHPTVRAAVLGEDDVQPTPAQLDRMRALVDAAMADGAMGLTTALIYAPATYAKTPELTALAIESARCGGLYSAHMRSEGDHIADAVAETVAIARASGGPAHIYHLKLAGRDNWGKRDAVLAQINAARAGGVRVTADMYTYAAAATGLDAAMPPWVQDGGLEKWIARLKDPATRARVLAEMAQAHPDGWENYILQAGGGSGVRLLAFKNPALKPLTGKTLAEVAAMRGTSVAATAIDLVAEDGSRVGVAYSLMSEDNVRRQLAEPFVAIDSDEGGLAPESAFLKSSPHPRAYGSFARLFAKYVRDEHVMTTQEAVRRVTALPADILFLKDRGRLRAGNFADVVIFDPATIQDHATFEAPHQLATGVTDVLVNGRFAVRDGVATGAPTGRIVRGRGWRGWPDGGCRRTAADWPQA